MWFVLGIPLALLTGFIAARYLEWHRIKADAMSEFVRLPQTLGNAAYESNPFAITTAFHYLLHLQPLELMAAGQNRAGEEISAVRDTAKKILTEALNDYDVRVLQGLAEPDDRFRGICVAGEQTLEHNKLLIAKLVGLEPQLLPFFSGSIADIVALVGLKESVKALGRTKENEGKVH